MRKSAGLLPFRRKGYGLEVFLAHMGGPFWERKDDGAWSIIKGEFEETEPPFEAALREFREETGLTPNGEFIELSPIKQPGGKQVFAWAVEWDCDPALAKSNTFTMEWPRGSGKLRQFPEIDRAAWFPLPEARRKILKGQLPLLEQLKKESSAQG
jgi:predicted NUDIX family NTP pyrophosphohydrolase